jgi:asparaginyl-tRNA synthetase
LFKVPFFGKQAYLAQSDQLYLELITPHIPRVWAEIQSFRAEPEADDRHLCQFSLFELEFQGDLEQLITHISGVVRFAAAEVASTCPLELNMFDRKPQDLYGLKFDRITYCEALDILKDYFPELKFGDDLKSDHEAKLAQLLGPHFITHYPKDIKFFNMLQNKQDPRLVNSTDLILPFAGEAAGAAEREHDYDRIVHRLKSSDMYKQLIKLGGLDQDFDWYLNAHKNKTIPLHSGTGIGMARIAQFLLGLDDIRDAVPFVVNSENLL